MKRLFALWLAVGAGDTVGPASLRAASAAENADRRRRPQATALTAALLLICAVAAVQWMAGAYDSDFTDHPDEAAHVVTSLMIHDYVASGFPGHPIRFAEDYYLHFPKVALGHWPPLFHTGEAAWMLVFGRNRGALLTFVAAIGAAVLVGFFLWQTNRTGVAIAFVSSLALCAPYYVKSSLYSVTPNLLLAGLAFSAALAYAEYMTSRQRSRLWMFIGLASACVLTHGRGAPVLFVPFLAEVIHGRRRFSRLQLAMIAAALIAVLFLPHMIGQTGSFSPLSFIRNAALYLNALGAGFGWPFIVAAAGGAWSAWRRRRESPVWSSLLALLASAWVVQSAMNIPWEDRYAILAVAPVCALFSLVLEAVASGVRTGSLAVRLTAIVAGGIVLYPLTARLLTVPRKTDLGYHRWFVREFLPQSAPSAAPAGVLLVAGDALHEGALIAEAALERTPHRYVVLRASKMLSSSTWSGAAYRMLYSDTGSVSGWLDSAHVSAVLARPPLAPHGDLLLRTLGERPAAWSRLPDQPERRALRIFRRNGPLPAGEPHIRIDMLRFGRSFEPRH